MKRLIIVESPGKIKKIKSFLDNTYIVIASVGHIRDLVKNNNAIDIKNNFRPTYEILPDKINVIKNIKKVIKDVDEIYISTDNDREGEAIAYHLIEVLKLKKYKRATFNEITKNAIINSLNNPKELNINLFYAQQARRILDRIVGFSLSGILKYKIGRTLDSKNIGSGRVQAVCTKLIVEKENEINTFLNSDISLKYICYGKFVINNCLIIMDYIHYNYEFKSSIKIELIKKEILNKDLGLILLNIKLDPWFYIFNIKKKRRISKPPLPFITSTLQQESYNKLKFNIKITMILAQKLYEKGYITYMRTDSYTLSNYILNDIKHFIISNYGTEYYQLRKFKSKHQEAHEAIRPTNINLKNLDNTEFANSNENKLYQLIWRRTLASQFKDAEFDDIKISVKNSLNSIFVGTETLLIFEGHLKLVKYNYKLKSELDFNNLKNNKVNWKYIEIKESFTMPPLRYNEATLVKKLEKLNIGRPSTYCSIINKILEHQYIKIADINGINKSIKKYRLYNNLKIKIKTDNLLIGYEKKKIIPTNDGIKIINFLIKYFPQIMNYEFTAEFELSLDKIASGEIEWFKVLNDFYIIFNKQLLNL